MQNLVDEVAELLYMADAPVVAWNIATEDDRKYFKTLGLITVDAVASHLRSQQNMLTDGSFVTAVSLLDAEVELARLQK